MRSPSVSVVSPAGLVTVYGSDAPLLPPGGRYSPMGTSPPLRRNVDTSCLYVYPVPIDCRPPTASVTAQRGAVRVLWAVSEFFDVQMQMACYVGPLAPQQARAA